MFDPSITQVVKVWGGVDSSAATAGLVSADDDDNDGGLELDGDIGEGGVMYSLGRGFAHEVSDSHHILHTIPSATT